MVRLFIGNVFTVASCETQEEEQAIHDAISYRVENLEVLRRKNKRLRKWDGIKSFFDRKNRCFLTGFVWLVIKRLRQRGKNIEVIERRERPFLPEKPDYRSILEGITLRDYQVRGIEKFLEVGRGVYRAGTGAGKTEVATALYEGTNLKALFLTHRAHLLHQTAKRFMKRLPGGGQGRVGMIGDGIYEPGHVTIATVQTLDAIFRAMDDLTAARKTGTPETMGERIFAVKRLGAKANEAQKAEARLMKKYLGVYAKAVYIEDRFRELVDFLNTIHCLVIDEAHRSGAMQFYRPAIYCVNAFFRLALTATPFIKGNARDDLMLLGIAGPIFDQVPPGELIDAGVLARPFFKFFDITEPSGLSREPYRIAYVNGIIHNAFRNKIIAMQVGKLTGMGRKTLVIVKECEHGKVLEALLSEAGIRVAYINGRNTQSERERALDLLERDRLDAVVATNIFDEGIDADVIGAVVLAAGEKSAPALFQRTGRAMRRKENENFAVIMDFLDHQHPSLLEHSMRRFELVRSEKGFTILWVR